MEMVQVPLLKKVGTILDEMAINITKVIRWLPYVTATVILLRHSSLLLEIVMSVPYFLNP